MRKKGLFIIVALFMVLVLSSCTAKVEGKNIENKKLEDLNYFCEMLEKNHKNLYANISKEEFLKEKKSLSEKLEDISEPDFYYSLKSLLSKVGDAHTNVYYKDSKYDHLHGLPFAVVKFEDDWRLFMLEREKERYLGYKLISINDTSIDEVFEKSKSIMSFENDSWAEMQFSNTINFKEALEYLGIVDDSEDVILKIEDNDGTSCDMVLKSMEADEIIKADIIEYNREATPETLPSGIYSSMEVDDNNFLIQYNSCEEAPDLPMEKFIEIVKEDISNGNYRNIIIDMRYNFGGNSAIFEPMIKMLKEEKKKKNFKVYTLIGKQTFSSAIINSIETKDELESTLVGTATGGNVNGYGELKSFDLKNHSMLVYYSTKYFELIKGYEKDSLYPDVEIVQSFDDYNKGIDVEIEFIKRSK